MRWEDEQDAIAVAANKFPAEFGMRGFPGKTFSISRRYSYVATDAVVLALVVKQTSKWECFGKGSVREIQAELVQL